MSEMTQKLKAELSKQIQMKNKREKINELRSAFSEGREFLRELTAQNNPYTIDHMINPIIKDQTISIEEKPSQ
jgi:hypothetical protein